jgi:hypothetical protein
MPQHGLRSSLVAAAAISAAAGLACAPAALADDSTAATQTARGVVFLDADGDGVRDPGERGIAGVRVSNGLDIVTTDAVGRYTIPVAGDDIVFVIKPRGYATPTNDRNLPVFHHIHKPNGSPDEEFLFKGVEPTGPLPASIDFPLHQQNEPDRFSVVFMGDPQPYTEQQVAYFARQVIGEIRAADNHGAAFAVALGDLVGDDLDLFDPYTAACSMLGIPFYNVFGNHDMNFKAERDEHADETFERVFGPSDYAFQYGPVHFLVLNNVRYRGFHGYREDGFPNTGNYSGGLTGDQLAFIENFVATVPEDELIVISMHIPFYNPESETHSTPEHRAVLEILSGHPHTVSLSAHTHRLWSAMLASEHGYTARREDGSPAVHQHLNAGATCGSWWRGPLDEARLPLSTMTDGTPSGYLIATFDGNEYAMRFKAAGEPADYQMRINAPDVVSQQALAEVDLTVNAFMATGDDTIELRFLTAGGSPINNAGGDGFVTLHHAPGEPDPAYVELYEDDQARSLSPEGRSLRRPNPCTHLFRLPAEKMPELPAGTYLIETRYTDMYGQQHAATRPIRVTRD